MFICKLHLSCPYTYEHTSSVCKSNGKVSWFDALPSPLVLHGEHSEDHLESAQDFNPQSLCCV